MLSSITPLGERARGNRWGVTIAAYLAGSVVGGAAAGAAFGAVGLGLAGLPGSALLLAAAAACAAGLTADAWRPAHPVPTLHRQVDEDWLGRYRGWVYGAGFGVQLGAGLATIVASATTYLTFFFALLTGSPSTGVAIGATFGLVRALPILRVRRVDHPAALRHQHRRLISRARQAHGMALTAQGAAGLGLLAVGLMVGVGS